MKKWKGQGLVEFALVLPILLLVIFSIVETALVIQGYLTVQHVAREAARFAVSYQPVQGACVDLDGDGMIEDGINDNDPPAGDGGDPDDVSLAAALGGYPYCPKAGKLGNERDDDYYERRVELIKLEARRAAAGLRINSYNLENDDFDDYGDEPCFFGVGVWGYPSFEEDCNTYDPWDENNPCLDHPGLEGLPVLVFVKHNVEILDPFYRAIVETVPVQAQAQMINEGVQVGFGDIPPPEFIINPGEREEPIGDGCIVVLSPHGATNILPGDTNHVFTATVTKEGQPVEEGKTVHFSTSAGEFDYCGSVSTTDDGTTDAQGQVSVTICKDSKGTANIHAWVDDGGSDWATKTWIEETEVYDIALSPKDATNAMPDDRSHEFVATVTDKQGGNVEGARVGFSTDLGAFDFSGVETRYAENETDADGQASVTVYGNYSGTATIHAWVEYGAIGSLDPGEPYTVATKTWTVSGPYITVSDHEVIPLDYIYADVMDHPAGTYDLWWCVISGTDTSAIVSNTFDVDAGGDATNLELVVPLGSKGFYRLETHPSGGGEDCDDTPVAHSADIRVVEAPPDLTVADFDVPALVCPETVFVMSAVVANDTGGSTDRTFDVDFYVDPAYTPPQSPVGETKQWVKGIGPNEQVTVTTKMWVDSPGEHTIWARVDTSDYVEEREPVGEDNNVEKVTITAAPSGCRYPAANAPVGGDGFENHPENAYTDGGGCAESRDNGGTDQHQYYNFDFDIPGSTTIEGIEVRLDWWLDDTGGTNSIGVELSWDGGAHWTPAKTDSTVTTTEHTVILGGPDDTWGRTEWSSGEFKNNNFRVRVSTTSTDPSQDFYLDWIAVRVIGPLECVGWPESSPWGGDGETPGQVKCDQLLRSGDFESAPGHRWDDHWNAGEEDDAWQCPADRLYGGSGYTMRLNASLGSRAFGCPVYHPYLWQRTLAIPQEVYAMTTMHVRGQWWVDISTTDCCTGTTDTDDVLYLKMRDSGGIDLGTPTKIVTGGAVSSDWELFEVDVTGVVDPYNRAGEEVQVYFDATHDEDENCTWFYLDELECEVCTYWGIPDPVTGTASIGGDVRVLVGGIPKMLPGVDVWAYSQGGEVYHAVTIQDSTYHFYNIPPDTYVIYAEGWVGQGLYSATETVTVVADERNYDVDLSLL